MDLKEYQRQVMGGMFTKEGVDKLTHAALGLAGEAGEVADLVKKSQYEGRSLDIEALREEAGDVLWYLTYIAGLINCTIEDLAKTNLQKLAVRHPSLYSVPMKRERMTAKIRVAEEVLRYTTLKEREVVERTVAAKYPGWTAETLRMCEYCPADRTVAFTVSLYRDVPA